jgi:hypothetical protein
MKNKFNFRIIKYITIQFTLWKQKRKTILTYYIPILITIIAIMDNTKLSISLDQKINFEWLSKLINDKYFNFSERIQDKFDRQILVNIIHSYCGELSGKLLDNLKIVKLRTYKSVKNNILRPNYIHLLNWIKNDNYDIYINLLESRDKTHCKLYKESLSIGDNLLISEVGLSELYYDHVRNNLYKISNDEYAIWNDDSKLWNIVDEQYVKNNIMEYLKILNVSIEYNCIKILENIALWIENLKFKTILNMNSGFLPIKNGKIVDFKGKKIIQRFRGHYFDFESPVEIETNEKTLKIINNFMMMQNYNFHKLLYSCITGEVLQNQEYKFNNEQYIFFKDIIGKILDKSYSFLYDSMCNDKLPYVRLIVYSKYSNTKNLTCSTFAKHIMFDIDNRVELFESDLNLFEKMRNEYLNAVFTWIFKESSNILNIENSISDFLEICEYDNTKNDKKETRFLRNTQIWKKYEKFCISRKLKIIKPKSFLYDRLKHEKMSDNKTCKFLLVKHKGNAGFRDIVINY